MTWDEFLAHNMQTWSTDKTILVSHPSDYLGKPHLAIWLVHGDMQDFDDLFEQCQKFAKSNGYAGIVYSGRRGWIRTHGFKELAVFAVKEI